MEGTREAEMIVQFALQGMMYALRLSGSAAVDKMKDIKEAVRNEN